MKVEMENEILSINDVADLTGYSKATIYSMVSRKELPHYKPTPRKLVFKRSEMEAWMLSNRVPTNAELDIEANSAAIKRGKK